MFQSAVMLHAAQLPAQGAAVTVQVFGQPGAGQRGGKGIAPGAVGFVQQPQLMRARRLLQISSSTRRSSAKYLSLMVNTRFCISCKWALCSLAQGRMIFWYGRYRARQLVVAMTVTGLFWLEPESTSPNKRPDSCG